jgi:hypothetical protein
MLGTKIDRVMADFSVFDLIALEIGVWSVIDVTRFIRILPEKSASSA